mmetsp:Transcript_48448/g.122278  ORF Transcript_48448/g.122278 Transcript_48448/m.122278 type:complete len:200 (-) Transcript_48448:881-1480(-)
MRMCSLAPAAALRTVASLRYSMAMAASSVQPPAPVHLRNGSLRLPVMAPCALTWPRQRYRRPLWPWMRSCGSSCQLMTAAAQRSLRPSSHSRGRVSIVSNWRTAATPVLCCVLVVSSSALKTTNLNVKMRLAGSVPQVDMWNMAPLAEDLSASMVHWLLAVHWVTSTSSRRILHQKIARSLRCPRSDLSQIAVQATGCC